MTKTDAIRKLESDIRDASATYYNTGKTPVIDGKKITDAVFDSWVDKLRELSPESPTLKLIGSPTPSVKVKVKLPFHMGSQDKLKPDTANPWLLANKGPYVVSDKEDGTSIGIVYSKNTIKAYTRGDGTYGQDISFLVKHLRLPEIEDAELKIRGEMIISKAKFSKYWKESFENSRNMVSGITNRKSYHEGFKDIDVIIYEVLEPRMQPSQAFKMLKGLGFKVVPYETFQTLTAESLSELLQERKENSKYEIDGLVVTVDKKNPITVEGNPKYSRAFKEMDLNSFVQTTVIRVEWNVSKDGRIKPRVEVNPVRVSGVTVSFATGDNAKNIIDSGIGPGAIVTISRRGEVIPKIENVIKKAKPQLPDMDASEYAWDATKVNFVIQNKSANKEYAVKRLIHFFKVLGVENFSDGLIERFAENGLDTVKRIIRATSDDFKGIPGIQDKSASKIYSNIQSKLKNVPLAKLMTASGAFRNMAEKRIQSVLDVMPEILSNYTSTTKNALASMIISRVPGFSEVLAEDFVAGLYEFSAWYVKHNEITYINPVKTTPKAGGLSGTQVVFTGFRDHEAEEKITRLGGTIGSSVSRNTSLLVVKDKSSASGKTQKADSLGVKIMDRSEFNSWLARF